jgi:hypothetical protein
MRASWLLFAGSLVFVSPHARAQEAQSFELGWVRGAGAERCPAESSIAERVEARLGRKPFAARASHAIEASVSRAGERFTATIVVRDATGAAVGSRELALEASDCAPVADAVALAIALVIDPNAALGPQVTPAPVPPTPGEPPRTEPPPPLPCPPPRECAPCAVCPAPPPPPASEFSLGLVARGGLAFGALPVVAPGAGLRGWAGGEWLRGTVSVWVFPEQRASDERFSFGLAYGELGACAVLLREGAIAVGACGGVGAGAIHAVVRDLPAPRAGQRLFVGAAAGPELALRLARGVHAMLGAELQVPLLAPEFYGEPSGEPVFQSSVGALTWLGAGFELPERR